MVLDDEKGQEMENLDLDEKKEVEEADVQSYLNQLINRSKERQVIHPL